MTNERINSLITFQKNVNIQFSDINILNTAFLHSSYVNEHPGFKEDNEKLELLGDSILAFIVNEFLYFYLPQCNEGELSRIKSIIVSEHSLSEIAKRLEIGKFLLLGKGEVQANGMNRKAILADTMEALLGAYFIDSGLEKVKKFILPHILTEIDKINKNEHKKDYKTQLQLIMQQLKKLCPTYETISEEGPDHEKVFYVNVLVDSILMGKGSGSSKKHAQQDAARDALFKLGYETEIINESKDI